MITISEAATVLTKTIQITRFEDFDAKDYEALKDLASSINLIMFEVSRRLGKGKYEDCLVCGVPFSRSVLVTALDLRGEEPKPIHFSVTRKIAGELLRLDECNSLAFEGKVFNIRKENNPVPRYEVKEDDEKDVRFKGTKKYLKGEQE